MCVCVCVYVCVRVFRSVPKRTAIAVAGVRSTISAHQIVVKYKDRLKGARKVLTHQLEMKHKEPVQHKVDHKRDPSEHIGNCHHPL